MALHCLDAPQEARQLTGKLVFVLQLAFVCRHGFKRLKKFDLQIANCYSNPELRSVKQTRLLMNVLMACSFCSAMASIIGREFFGHNPHLLVIPSLTFGTLLFGVGYTGMKQVFCIDELEDEMAEDDVQEAPAAQEADKPVSRLQNQLESLMNDERLYLQPGLRLSDVAGRLGVGRTTLSAFINQTLAMSFSDYVNSFRIRHAQEILSDDALSRTLSTIQVSERSGFTSEASFYRAFRRHTGMTPKQWNKENQQI